eukprot:766963-Hanusia_phi.AAC.4
MLLVIERKAFSKHAVMAVGFDDFRVRLYDACTLKHILTLECENKWPTALTSFLLSSRDEQEGSTDKVEKQYEGWFVWGDSHGYIHVFSEDAIMAFRSQQDIVHVFSDSLANYRSLKVFPARDREREIWCNSIKFLPDVGIMGVCLVAGSNGAIAIASLDTMTLVSPYQRHRSAVKCLEWCGRHNNVLASAGLERSIHLWRPNISTAGKHLLCGELLGHNAGIVDLAFHEIRDVLFSLDSSGMIVAWDIASRTPVSRVSPLTQNPSTLNHKICRILVPRGLMQLLTGSNHIKLLGVKPLDLRRESEKVIAHEADIVVVLYNDHFDLLLTVDKTGFVSIWHCDTGLQSYKFMCESVQETVETPAISFGSFDISSRRLMVGWSQGSVQLYNFSNGSLVNNLISDSCTCVNSIHDIEFSKRNKRFRSVIACFGGGYFVQWMPTPYELDVKPVRELKYAWGALILIFAGKNNRHAAFPRDRLFCFSSDISCRGRQRTGTERGNSRFFDLSSNI